jgi:hypothetical protein
VDPNFRIYRDKEEFIPTEDRARLEGYLKGREEQTTVHQADFTRSVKNELAAIRQKAQSRRAGA